MTPNPGGEVDRCDLDEPRRLALERQLRATVRGDVMFDSANRAAYATDSSNYRQVPLGVVCPRDHDDVVSVMRACAAFGAPVVARGGGTSLAGQACNVAVVVDTSRYMTRIVRLDPDSAQAIVETGVVLDDLRRAAEEHGLTFGPDPATHAWCTIGGMVGNNSCGTHALYAGKTVDNVERLRVVTYGGETLDVGAYDERAYGAAVAGGGPLSSILGGLRELAARYGPAIRQTYPDIPRRVSGFNLDQLLPEAGFHVARALVGTESTCGIVTEATLRLTRSPGHRRVVVLGFPDIFAAADAVPALVAFPLLGLEGFDRTLVEQMHKHRLNLEHLPLLPGGDGWLLAELGDDTAERADAATTRFIEALPAGVRWRRYDDPSEQQRVWAIRESGLGATALRLDGTHNLEGWEDAAVPIDKLGSYLRAMTKIWQRYGYSGAWYGHFGQGCVHTRNNFDLRTVDGLRKYRAYVEESADLVVSLGGSLSGEHGDGQARGELLARMFGDELVGAFRQFKAIFDPLGKMNPGKVVDPYPLDTNLRFGPAHQEVESRPRFFAFRGDGGSFQRAVERCVGVGRCRRDDSGVMCPSYRVTRDERHSTRGRAKLLAEMFQGQVTPRTWRNRDVKEALDLCLSCKGCVVDCPTHVDMATYKSEFLAHHYAHRLRPRAMYALGLIPLAARVATRLPRVANAMLSAPGVSNVLKRVAGVTTARPAPTFAKMSWRRGIRAQKSGGGRRLDASVVVWPDTFTDAFRPQLGRDTVAILEAFGETVAVPDAWACCGRPLYDTGMLKLARRWLTSLLDVLDPWIASGTPVVVVEPSCLAAFRDELPALLPDDPRAEKLSRLARSLAEHLVDHPRFDEVLAPSPSGLALPPSVPPPSYAVHPHCHARVSGAAAADVRLLERLGATVEALDAGCCGMAGSFGFRAEHEKWARKIGEDWWLPRVRRAAESSAVVVDGFSCSTQLEHLNGGPCITTVDIVRERVADRAAADH